jgi:hypothetical protein
MNLSLTSLLPTLLWVALGITGLAIGLGRQVPRPLPTHERAVPRYQGINGRVFMHQPHQPRMIDRATGRMVLVDRSSHDILDYSVCSPWRDERGQFQVVSRWVKREGPDRDDLPQEFGVARHTVPEGKLIDRVALDILPVSEPCWVPGQASRILFVAGNGGLYHYRFPGAAAERPPEPPWEQPEPQRVSWRMAPPGAESVAFRDLVWPTHPRLGGRLIGSVWPTTRSAEGTRMLGSRLWWIELGSDGMEIEAAGPLVLPDSDAAPAPAEDQEDRLPNVGTTAQGEPLLAYLHRSKGQTRWELRLARITIDPQTGTPSVQPGDMVRLARDCVATSPVFALDGRSIYTFLGADASKGACIARRFSIAGAAAVFSPPRLVRNGSGRHAR